MYIKMFSYLLLKLAHEPFSTKKWKDCLQDHTSWCQVYMRYSHCPRFLTYNVKDSSRNKVWSVRHEEQNV